MKILQGLLLFQPDEFLAVSTNLGVTCVLCASMMRKDGEFCGLFFKNIRSNHSQSKSELMKPDGVDLYNPPLISFPVILLGTFC